ncbi:MAG TPA: ankyrin repeat domain-containing protein [Bryobacteraceae bacterium]|jgi:ankyrin repeat protein|nr:ankyrin repeat domain-containing protein [Bryobacteraceae bacterium]
MSTELPPNANLEHLKKEAKALLAELRGKDHGSGSPGRPKLSDAQNAVARKYGFENWPKLKEHVQSTAALTPEILQRAMAAFHANDAAALGRLLKRHPALRAKINEPIGDFDSPLIIWVRSRAMLDVLLDAGADVNARSRWWAGGFGLLDLASPEVSAAAIRRGALVTVHAAARLGMIEKLKELVAADPALVHARGGDGQTPLHFASTVEIAEYLLDHGAGIDVRDVDHESTPAQYMVRSRQEVARYLVRRGCKTDILMAAALGDLHLVRKHLDADPESIRTRVSEEWFPMTGSSRAGGTIYQWELGWHVSAAQVAKAFGHSEVFDLLMERSPLEEKLLNACWLHDEALVASLLAQRPNVASLSAAGRRQLAHAARNNDTAAARLMIAAGLPVEARGQHRGTTLHWAAWHGNIELVRLILAHHPDIEDRDNDFKASPLGWATHGSLNGWYREKGDYPATVEALLDAGARPPAEVSGSKAVQAILRRRG